jgi:hypothetical protein
VEEVAEALRRAEEEAGRLRAVFFDELRGAQAAGASLSAMARAAGVSRQRMQRLAREL